MNKMSDLCSFLGPMYFIETRDKVPSICRTINDSLELEIDTIGGEMILCLWQIKPHKELMAIYNGIRDKEVLADAAGHLSFIYQNLQEKIRVEREDSIR